METLEDLVKTAEILAKPIILTRKTRSHTNNNRPNNQPIQHLQLHKKSAAKFEQALAILKPPNHSSMEAKLKAQLLALWLNYAAGWTGGYTLKGMTAQQIIGNSENEQANKCILKSTEAPP